MDEMDRFYGAVENESHDKRLIQVNGALFGSLPSAHALLAWDDVQLVGIASYSFLWPAVGATLSLYLKELYVLESHRHQGIGRLLMESLCTTAVEAGCSRVEWTTDVENLAAQRFYERLGLVRNPTKLFYRLEGTAMRDLTRRSVQQPDGE